MHNQSQSLHGLRNADGWPWFRRLSNWVSRRCLRWMYRDLRFVNVDHVPEHGAVLLIGNHPNDLPDVMLGYIASPRPIRYIATIAAAFSSIAKAVYRGLGVIPVARARDARAARRNGVDPSAINVAAGLSVEHALQNGHAIGLFPEGGVHHAPHLMKPRPGVARMLIQYAAKNDSDDRAMDVTIVPFGIQYESPHEIDSDVSVVFGPPVSLFNWWRKSKRESELARASEQSPAIALAALFYDLLTGVTRNAADWRQAEIRDRVIAALTAVSLPHDPLLESHRFVEAAQVAARNRSPHAVRMTQLADELAVTVASVGGNSKSARDHADLVRETLDDRSRESAMQAALWLACASPFAIAGWIVHLPPFIVLRWLARKLATDPTELVARSFLPGALIVILAYAGFTAALAAALEYSAHNPAWAFAFVLVAPRLGDVAIEWKRRLKRFLMLSRMRKLTHAERLRVRSLAEELRELCRNSTTEP